MSRLAAAVRCAVAGRGSTVVIVEGAPGTGKSRALSALAAVGREAGAQVRTASAATTTTMGLPMGTLAAWVTENATWFRGTRAGGPVQSQIDHISRAGGRMNEGSTAVEPLMCDILLKRIRHASRNRSVVVVVDDVDRADDGTLRVLHRMARLFDLPGVVLAVAHRPVDPDSTLARLVRDLVPRGALTARLGPLPDEALGSVLAHRVGGTPGPRLMSLARSCGGSPGYLHDVLSSPSVRDRLVVDGDRVELAVEPDDEVLAPAVSAVLPRVGPLEQAQADLVRAVALVGPGATFTEIASVLGAPVLELADLMVNALRAGLLVECEAGVSVAQPVVGRALVLDVPPALRSALSAHAARRLVQSGADPGRVATCVLGGAPWSEALLAWLEASADTLIGRCPRLAVQVLRSAVVHLESAGADPGALARRLQQAEAAAHVDRTDPVAGSFLPAVPQALAVPGTAVDLTVARARGGGADLSGLTDRERRVVALVVAGRSTADLAAELVLSPRTVQHQISRILAKLGVGSRAELAGLVAGGAVTATATG